MENKKRLGPVKTVEHIKDSEFQLKNDLGDSVDLDFKNLRPLILGGNDPLKKTLLAAQNKSVLTFISIIRMFLEKFGRNLQWVLRKIF